MEKIEQIEKIEKIEKIKKCTKYLKNQRRCSHFDEKMSPNNAIINT